jgi:hypothetical protein
MTHGRSARDQVRECDRRRGRFGYGGFAVRALSFIHTAKIQRGQDVLVHGATEAIGSAAAHL